jgi:NADP-dependent aldehyde dehydrogenase
MEAGQFCTNPGLVFGLAGADLDRFEAAAAAALKAYAPPPMLTPGIHKAYEAGVQGLSEHNQVETIARGLVGEGVNQGQGALFATDAKSFMADERLGHEVFGSSSLVVRCPDVDTLLALSERLEGQLTATLQMDAGDAGIARQRLSGARGRIWPMAGDGVGARQVHGGRSRQPPTTVDLVCARHQPLPAAGLLPGPAAGPAARGAARRQPAQRPPPRRRRAGEIGGKADRAVASY